MNYAATDLPFGGWKESGIGVRHGAGGIRKYCKTHSRARHALRAEEGAAHVPLLEAD